MSTVRALVAIAGEAGEGQNTALKVSAVTKVAAVGKATARALEAAGVTEVSVPTSVLARDLASLPEGLAELAGRWADRSG